MPNNNPTGKGGFKDNPQNISGGMWSKETSISYWYNKLIRMPVEEIDSFKPETMAQQLAYNSILEARAKLDYLKEVTDRTEGRASQSTDITSGGKELNQVAPTIVFIDSDNAD